MPLPSHHLLFFKCCLLGALDTSDWATERTSAARSDPNGLHLEDSAEPEVTPENKQL